MVSQSFKLYPDETNVTGPDVQRKYRGLFRIEGTDSIALDSLKIESATKGECRMNSTRTLVGILLLLITCALQPVTAAGGSDPCETSLEGWEKMTDTTAVVPDFVFGGQLDVDKLLVCDSGVYFFFRAREWGSVIRFCLAYPVPSQEETAKFYGQDAADVQERMQKILTVTAQATRTYEKFKGDLREVLGKQYVEGRIISFNNQRFKATLELSMGESIEFSWRRRSASFLALIDVYIAPRSTLSPLVIFLLLYTGPAYGVR